jgi:replication-associated recombination protein RarA
MTFDELIKKGIDNLRFALNLDDYIPEHIKQELTGHRANKIAQGADQLIFDNDNDLGINGFGSSTKQIFHYGEQQLLRQKQTDERLFSEIHGYNDIKKLMMRCISSPEAIHVILDGAPASGKSIFLLSMQKGLDDSYFVDCTNATGPGMVNYLFKNDVKYLLLDEVEKMSRSDQNVLLNVLETGVLTSTKMKKTASKEMNLSVFATTNDIDAISKPFRSRFVELSLPSYTYEEFCSIAVELLANRYEHTEEISMKIADVVWNKIKSKDVRDILTIGKLSKTVDDVDFVTTILQKYKRRNDDK